MKKTHIIGIIIIAVALGIVITTMGETSKYVTFKEALAYKEDQLVHVVGSLKKNEEKVDMVYNPSHDPNFFSFQLLDENNEERTVVYHDSKPQDFERSEKVVVVGYMKNNKFIAKKILMKCPSKYEGTDKVS